MKLRWLPLIVVLVVALCTPSVLQAQKVVTIPQIQQVSLDSLIALDALQGAAAGKTKDDSPYWNGSDAKADTVKITGVVIVPPRILTYTLARYNIFVQDTTTGQLWAGLNVLTNDTSATAQSTGITALDSGYVVEIVGRVTEYGSQNNSLSEMFAYSVGFFEAVTPIGIVGIGNRPQPVEVTCDSFATGTTPKPSRGEKYEGMYVIFRNVTVVSVDQSSGRFTFQDTLGNQVTMYDGSGWYTYRGHKYSQSRYTAPPVGTKLKYVRGVMITQSKSGTCGDYEIMPLYPGPKERTGSTYPGDVVVDRYAPSITTIRRNPTPPKSTDNVTITFQAKDLNTLGNVDSAFVAVKKGLLGTWTKTKVATPSFIGADTLYAYSVGSIVSYKDSIISYYVEAYSGGQYGASPDPTIPNYFVVRDNGHSIYDVQYTPYTNGTPGLSFDTVTVAGVVVSDTTDIKEFPTSGAQNGRPSLWIAAKAGVWNGVAMYGASAGLGIDTLRKGDSVSVTGVVQDNNGRTIIRVTSPATVIQTGRPVPGPTTMSISGGGSVSYQISNPPVSGNATFEQWEGTLVQINNPYLVIRNSDDLTDRSNSCFGEFFISSSSSTNNPYGLRVDDNGVNPFYADTNAYYRGTRYKLDHPQTPNLKTTLITVGQRLSFLRGILDYSFSNYKLEPRTAADFGTITGVVYEDPSALVRSYELTQNYPNPFNPTTNIRYSIPVGGHVTLKIYNMLGQLVETLIDHEQTPGAYVATFNAARLSTGVYFYQLQAGDFRQVKKMLLLK